MQTRLISIFVFILIFMSNYNSHALNNESFKHTDKNKDDKMDNYEHIKEKEWKKRKKTKPMIPPTSSGKVLSVGEKSKASVVRVSNAHEKKFDSNNDGWIDSSEKKNMLQYKYNLVMKYDTAKVESSIESMYDVDGNNVIDRDEAELMRQDMF